MLGATHVEDAASNEQRRRAEKADGTPCQSGAHTGIERVGKDLATVMLREQYRSLTRLVPILYAVVIVATAMLSYGLRSAGPAWLQIWLPAAIACVCVLRFRYWIGARKHVDDQDLGIIERDVRATSILGPAMSLGLTLIGVSMMHYGEHFQQSLAVTTIWLTAVASGFCLFALPRAAVLVVLSASVPLSAEFLMEANELMTLVAFLFMLISCLIVYMLRENFGIFAEIIQSRALITEKHRQAEVAKENATVMAYTDYLTKLSNRRHFEVLLTARVAAPSSEDDRFAVGILDLDGFKPINDAHGHAVGDAMLQQVAARLSSVMAGHGSLARMGGDEFAVIGEGIGSASEAIAFGQALQAVFAKPFVSNSISARLACTCGFALYPASGNNPARLIDRADMALYRIKAKERGGIAVFDADDESIALERAVIEQELRKAVVDGALNVHFQPIVDLTSAQIEGFEALARWHHPQLGHVSPAIFVPIAEQIGIMEQLTDTLLCKAATIASGWPSGLMLSFNLSPEQLSKPSAGLKILTMIAECGLPPQRFEAEVTESAVMNNIGNARNTIESLRTAGVRVALDDFGTGYSSLSQIWDLPLDKIKIDKSFIDRICTDPRIANLVRSIVDMCNSLELRCIAEGIESQDQLDQLRLCGCNSGQGYLFSRPLPLETVDEYICERARLARPAA